MSTQPTPYITEEQYLEIEESAEQKSEYFHGEMFPMEATVSHVRITGKMFAVLQRELAGSGCEPFIQGLRISVSKGFYTYPDLVVICGKLESSKKDKNSITNPKLIIEVLSPTTENYDRGKKFVAYRSIPSFLEYLLIAQDRIHVEHHTKQADGGWLMHEISDPDAILSLQSIGATFKLSEAYAGVEL